MSPVDITNYKLGQKDNEGYEYDTGNISTGTEGDIIIVPDNVHLISATLKIATSSSGKVQTCTNTIADVLANIDIVWVDWVKGSIIVTAQDCSTPCTAIRVVRESGTVRLLLRAQ